MNPLETVASWLEPAVPPSPILQKNSPSKKPFDLEGFIARHDLQVRRRLPWNDGEKFELEVCPVNAEHIGGCAVITRSGTGVLGFRCLHNSCSHVGWTELRAQLEPRQTRNPRESSSREVDGDFQIRDIPSVWSFDGAVSWLVEDLIPEEALTLLTGDSGVGKSTFALALAGAVASGGSFLQKVTNERMVLYVDRENPLGVVRERLRRLGIAETPKLAYWGLWNDPPPSGPSAGSIMRFVKEVRPLIVFDSLIGFHEGKEQDASETRRHLQHYRNLAAAGASIILLHHIGKAEGAKHYRGSSDIKAAVDCAYLLESLGGATTGLASLRLTPFKNRLALAEATRLEYSSGRFSIPHDRVESDRERIERIVRTNPNLSEQELVKMAMAAGMAKHKTEDLLLKGVQEQWWDVETGKRNRKTYRLREVDLGSL